MSLEAHHQFILNTMQRHDDIARKLIQELEAENARLKAEVERLKTHSFTADELTSMKAETELLHAQFKRDLFNQVMKENERLRKAGDELERVLTNRSGSYEAGNASYEWQSAKEGKQS